VWRLGNTTFFGGLMGALAKDSQGYYLIKRKEIYKDMKGIPAPFDPEKFRKEGHTLVDTLADYLQNALSGKEMAVLPWNDPEKLAGFFSFDSCWGAGEPFNDFIRRILENSIHIHHPNYIGHLLSFAPLFLITALPYMKWVRLIWQWRGT